MVAQKRGDLGAVRRPQTRLVRAVLGEPDRADQPLADLVGECDSRQAQSGYPRQRTERGRDNRDQGDPLDGPLARSGSATLERS
ncbi:MAG TPA: hypothetical protein VI028_02950 [Solirubrobacterales bacterium]